MTSPAFSFVSDIEPGSAREFRFDHHYLIYVSSGVLRLEADATSWTLPPARAALVRAGTPVEVTIVRPVRTASSLFRPDFVDLPPAEATVFEMTDLARQLVAECGRWQETSMLDDYAVAMFRALAAVTWRLAATPSPASMPTGRTSEVRRALELTDRLLAEGPRLTEVAAEVGLTTRSLARRFERELGMTWRASVRRLRVLRAIELLSDPEIAVTRVAVDVGYASLSAFEVAFRDLTGQTPTAFRNAGSLPR